MNCKVTVIVEITQNDLQTRSDTALAREIGQLYEARDLVANVANMVIRSMPAPKADPAEPTEQK